MPKLYNNRYRIPSSRKQNWNYGNNGAYFITICTKNRKHYFGNIMNGKMMLTNIGQLANEFWLKIPEYYDFIRLGAFVVMPNHVHGILVVDKTNDEINILDNLENDGKDVALQRLYKNQNNSIDYDHHDSQFLSQISPKTNTISTIIRAYKSMVTKYSRIIDHDFAWQERFYDHIIRNKESYERIENYIIKNPEKWLNDKFC